MDMRRVGLVLFAALVAASTFGCKKSAPGNSTVTESQPAPVSPVAAETVARVHWLGKKRIAVETNAAHFMSIWNLPEGARLESQTLDKLALAPWRLLKGDTATNGAPAALLRPLCDDLVQEESYLEARRPTNGQVELVIAIRLNVERAGVWVTNLATAMESLTGERVTPTSGGWSLKQHDAPELIELARAGDWTVVGLAQKSNTLLSVLTSSIQHNGTPFSTLNSQSSTNYWLTLELDLARVNDALSSNWRLPADLPRVSLSMIGDGAEVRTRGKLDFARPLELELEPWNIPTNLIHDPLVSFTAVRGIKPWLASLKVWQELNIGDPPNQFYAWGQQGVPLQTFFAAPLPDASSRIKTVVETVLQEGNPWLKTNGMGRLERLPEGNGVCWTGIPFMTLELMSVVTPGGEFAVGGLLPNVRTNLPPPTELIQTIMGWTNLISYQWEITQPRLETWLYIGQVFRLVTYKAQLPTDSAGYAWMKAAAPKLGNCITIATQNGSNSVSFVRQSSVGFTAVELHLLADWLESPGFPRGLHTFVSTLNVPRKKPGPAGLDKR